MRIRALALLRVPRQAVTRLPREMVVRLLEDGALVDTNEPFGRPPSDLVADLRARAQKENAEAALDAHDDPRGILFFPHLVATKAATYDGVVVEVGAAGHWGRREEVIDVAPSVRAHHPVEALEAALGGADRAAASAASALVAAVVAGDHASAERARLELERAVVESVHAGVASTGRASAPRSFDVSAALVERARSLAGKLPGDPSRLFRQALDHAVESESAAREVSKPEEES